MSQDDRIEIANELARGEPVEVIAARIGKTLQSVYREIARNHKPDGRYQPWYAHNGPTSGADAPSRAGSA
jgi:IS30 family transposase